MNKFFTRYNKSNKRSLTPFTLILWVCCVQGETAEWWREPENTETPVRVKSRDISVKTLPACGAYKYARVKEVASVVAGKEFVQRGGGSSPPLV